MIDISKINVGDEVMVRAKVIDIHVTDSDLPLRVDASGVGLWVRREDVANHTPAPRQFKPGDSVTWGSGVRAYEFIAQRGCVTIVWSIVWSHEYGASAPNLSELRHADESE